MGGGGGGGEDVTIAAQCDREELQPLSKHPISLQPCSQRACISCMDRGQRTSGFTSLACMPEPV